MTHMTLLGGQNWAHRCAKSKPSTVVESIDQKNQACLAIHVGSIVNSFFPAYCEEFTD
jgi:hypothetical protein